MTAYLDASALIKLFKDEPGVEEVEAVLERDACRVSAVNLLEAAYIVSRDHGVAVEAVRRRADATMSGLIAVTPVTEQHAWRAAELRARHYHGVRSDVSYADCLFLAAPAPGDTVVTSDRAVATAARAEDLDVVELPDSRGRRP